MKIKLRKPSWWLPALIVFGMMGVLFLEGLDRDLLPIGPGIEILTVLVGYGLLVLWVYANRVLLDSDDGSQYKIVWIEPQSLSSQSTGEPNEQHLNREKEKIRSAPQPFSGS